MIYTELDSLLVAFFFFFDHFYLNICCVHNLDDFLDISFWQNISYPCNLHEKISLKLLKVGRFTEVYSKVSEFTG